MSEVLDQLAILRGMTRSTGALHEAQAMQFRCWAKLIFPKATDYEILFCWEERTLCFRIWAKSSKKPAKFKRCMSALEDGVKTLLGEEYLVSVDLNEKPIFVGTRSAPVPKPADPEYDVAKFERAVFDRNVEKHLAEAVEKENQNAKDS